MGRNIDLAHLVVVLCFWMLVPCSCQQDDLDNNNNNATTTAVYVVTLRQAPASHNLGELKSVDNGFTHDAAAPGRTQFHKPSCDALLETMETMMLWPQLRTGI